MSAKPKETMTAKEYREHLKSKAPKVENTMSLYAKGNRSKRAIYHMVMDELALTPVLEYRFAPPRRFKFDMAFPELMIAIEYEGLNSAKSRHTTFTGYTNDCSKYNLATLKGWRVLRYTAKNYKEVCHDLPILLNKPVPPSKPQPELLEAVKRATKL